MGLVGTILIHNARCVVTDLEAASFFLEAAADLKGEAAAQMFQNCLDQLEAAHGVATVVFTMIDNLLHEKEGVPKWGEKSVDTLGIVASPGRPPENGPFDSPDTMAKREGVMEE